MSTVMRARSIRTASVVETQDALTQKGVDMATTGKQIEEAELVSLGIKRIPADIFQWGEYRYSHLRDAIAAAKRGDKR